jgi:hypothetical protein
VRLRNAAGTRTEHLVEADHGAFIFVLAANAEAAGRLRLEFAR